MTFLRSRPQEPTKFSACTDFLGPKTGFFQRMLSVLIAAGAIATACTPSVDEVDETAGAATSAAPADAATGGPQLPPGFELPPGMDMEKLRSALPEPAGPGTSLGPYAAVTIEAAAGLPSHTVYFPSDLSSFPGSDSLPVVVWGNGGCINDGKGFEGTLTKIASHGFLVVAVGVLDPKERLPSTTGAQMIEGIDWAERANKDAGPLRGKIDTDHVALMGQSCGGLMTIEAAHDARVDTIGVINSGVLNTPGGPAISSATKETLATFHSPALYLNGGSNDVAFPNANDDVERITGVPVFYGFMEGAGHGASHRHKNGGLFAEIMTAWLQYQLKDDPAAGKMFEGDDCSLCIDPAWTVTKKDMQ